MFYWLAAIPFFVALMMLAIVHLPSNDLKDIDNTQTYATAFRMASQHDAATRFVEANLLTADEALKSTMTSGRLIEQDEIETYAPEGFVGDYDTLKSYLVCTSSDCTASTRVNVLTILDPVKGRAWLDTGRNIDFLRSLNGFRGSFPLHRRTGEVHNYGGFWIAGTANNTTFAGKVGVKASNDGFLMEQKEGDEYVLGDEVYNFTIDNVKALGSGEPAIMTVAGEQLRPVMCSDTTPISNQKWIDNGFKCSGCGSNQFQLYDSKYDGGSCNYPNYIEVNGCLDIPEAGGSTAVNRAVSNAYGGGQYYLTNGTAYNQPIRHHKVKITCDGKNEDWRIVGPYVSWWEAMEICSKIGLNVPSSRSVLTNTTDCGGTDRWSLIKAAANTVNLSSYNVYAWTKEDYNATCNARVINLNNGSEGNAERGMTHYEYFAVCGPKS